MSYLQFRHIYGFAIFKYNLCCRREAVTPTGTTTLPFTIPMNKTCPSTPFFKKRAGTGIITVGTLAKTFSVKRSCVVHPLQP